jgi:hypothetical protein
MQTETTEPANENLRQFTRELPVTLNDGELQTYGKMLAEKVREEELAEEKKKQITSEQATKIKAIRNDIKRIADARAKGEELRPVRCAERLHGNVIEIVRLDRNEVVDTRPAELRDLQTTIPGTEIPDGFDEGPRGDDIGSDAPTNGASTGHMATSSVGDEVWTHETEDVPSKDPPGADVALCTYCSKTLGDDDEVEVLDKNGTIAHKECHEEAEIDRKLVEREASLDDGGTKHPAPSKPTRERSAKANAKKPAPKKGKR